MEADTLHALRRCHRLSKNQFVEDELGHFGDYVILTNNHVYQEQQQPPPPPSTRRNEEKAEKQQSKAEGDEDEMVGVKARAVELITFATGATEQEAFAQIEAAIALANAGESSGQSASEGRSVPPVLQAVVAKQQELDARRLHQPQPQQRE